jgi:Chitobiase/beta-hexosaminidase C-terminal domain
VLQTTSTSSSRRLRGLAAVALLAAATGLTAGATRADAAVTVGDSIEAFIGSNMVGVNGYPAGTDVFVIRNGVEIARAIDTVGAGGSQVLNHDACWDGATPDILPGDRIEARQGEADPSPDFMVVQDVFLDHAALQALPLPLASAAVPITGHTPGGTFTIQFRFGLDDPDRRHTITPNLPAGAFAQTTTITENQRLAWPPGETMLEAANGNELTVSDAEGGAGPGCAPIERSTASASDTVLAQGENLVLSGAAGTGITPTVAINGGGGLPATVTGGVWSMPIAAAQLNEGANTIVVTFEGPGGPAPTTIQVTKDTVAPATAPNVSPAGGTYTEAQSVTLNGVEGGGAAYYTTDGSTPSTASTRYTGPIPITSSQTLRVAQYDAAGNKGPVANHAYVITAPPAPPAPPQPQQQAAPPPIVIFAAPPSIVAPSTNAISAGALRMRGSKSLRTLRRKGLRFSVRASSSTRYLLVRLVRVTRTGRRTKRALIQERVVRVRSGGAYTGKLRIGKRTKTGRYELSIAPAGADEEYASSVRTAFRLTR